MNSFFLYALGYKCFGGRGVERGVIDTRLKQRRAFSLVVALALAAGTAMVLAPMASADKVQAIIMPGPLAADYLQAPALTTVDMAGFDQIATGTLGVIDIRDARGTGRGWNLVLAASDFVNAADAAHIISAATLNVATPAPVQRLAGNTPPQTFSGQVAPALKLLSAAPGAGMGRFQVDPPIILTIPADSFSGSYDSTLTLTLTTGP